MTVSVLAPAAALGVGALVFALARVVGLVMDGGHAQSRTRLHRITHSSASAAGAPAPQARVMRARRGPAAPALRAWIAQAGMPWEPVDLFVMTGMGAVVIGFLALILTRLVPVAMLSSVAGGVIPWVLVHRRAATRRARLNDQVVDMVELLASSLKSGFGVVQSLDLAGREQPEPMSNELQRVVREIHLGSNTEESLERFAQRSNDPDITLVITAVLVQRRVGGDLGEVLLNLAGTIRDRSRVRGEVRALTAQARMSAWVVGLLPVVLSGGLFILAPAHIGLLFTDPVGRLMAGGAVMLELVGFWMVQRVAQIDY